MALVFADRVKETTATTGTGTLTLAGAAAQYQSFAAVGDGNACDYCILSGNNTDWETGRGTYTASGTTLSRDVVYASSNAGSKISLTGTSAVSLSPVATRAANAAMVVPQGRVTLTSGTPVMTADVTGATTIYYAEYIGRKAFAFTITGGQVSMGLDAVTPHVASGSVYDIFLIDDGTGGGRPVIGPAWTSTTARGTGAGTTELARDSATGFWVNANSITNAWGGASGTTNYGPIAAGAAWYISSFYATANGQTSMQMAPAAAAGGSNAFMALYNAYNRVTTISRSRDNTTTWTYATATWRAANASNSNRVTYLDGLGQSQAKGRYSLTAQAGDTSAAAIIGVNFDSTSATPGGATSRWGTGAGTQQGPTGIAENELTALGLHYAQAMENAIAGHTSTFVGAPATGQTQRLTVELAN